MSKITVKKKTENFTILDNTLFKDESISWKAKGLLAYLLHLPNDWQIYLEDLKNRSTDGIDSTRSAMNELIEKGYIEIYEYPRSTKAVITYTENNEQETVEAGKTEDALLYEV